MWVSIFLTFFVECHISILTRLLARSAPEVQKVGHRVGHMHFLSKLEVGCVLVSGEGEGFVKDVKPSQENQT